PVHRPRLARASRDWAYAREIAEQDLKDTESADSPALRFFVEQGPSDPVTDWLEHHLTPELDYRLLNQIEESLVVRDTEPDIEPLLCYLRKSADRMLPPDDTGFRSSELVEAVQRASNHVDVLEANLSRWCEEERWLEPEVLSMVLTRIDANNLSETARRLLVGHLNDLRQATNDVDVTSLLVGIDSPEAEGMLLEELNAHVEGRVYYGLAQKAALMKALRRLEVDRPASVGLALIKRAWADVGNDPNVSVNALREIFSHYLLLVGEAGLEQWETHLPWIEKIIEARLGQLSSRGQGLFPGLSGFGTANLLWSASVDKSLGTLMGQLPEAEQIKLLNLPPPGHPVIPEGFRARFNLLLPTMTGPWSEALSERIVQTMAAFHLDAGASLEAAAKSLPADYLSWLADPLKSRNREGYAWLIGASTNTVWFANTVGRVNRAETLAAILEGLPSSDEPRDWSRHHRVLTRQLEVGVEPGDLLEAAHRAHFNHPALLAAAGRTLTDLSALTFWLAYASDDDLARLDVPEVRERLRQRLSAADPFDWLTTVQDFRLAPGRKTPDLLIDLATDRNVILSSERALKPALNYKGYFVMNPYYEMLLQHDPLKSQTGFHALIEDPHRRVEVVGDVSDAQAAGHAYLIWLWGRSLLASPERKPETLPESVNTMLRGKEPAEVRAAMLFILAMSRAEERRP
ncbi:MAG: hypothetical protein AAF492_11085, partial [Verrucomicrobiota bacterium]